MVYLKLLRDFSTRTVENLALTLKVKGAAEISAKIGTLVVLLAIVHSHDPDEQNEKRLYKNNKFAQQYGELNRDFVQHWLMIDEDTASNGRQPLQRFRNALAHFHFCTPASATDQEKAECITVIDFEDGPPDVDPFKRNWHATLRVEHLDDAIRRLHRFIEECAA